MEPIDLELARTLVATGVLLGATTLGVLVLPWRERDLRATSVAAVAAFAVAALRGAVARRRGRPTTPTADAVLL